MHTNRFGLFAIGMISIIVIVFLFSTCKGPLAFDDFVSETFCEHVFSEWTITREPTKTNAGEKYRSCLSCGYEQTMEYLLYEVGDIGPAGGYVFYDKGSFSDGWRYLEAAPADLRVVNGIPTVDSSVNGYSDAASEYAFGLYRKSDYGSDLYVNGTSNWDPSCCTGTAIGTGRRNTELLVAAMGTETYEDSSISSKKKTKNYAARLCDILTYTSGGITYDDWFLPSLGELNLIYTELKQKGLGCFYAVGVFLNEYGTYYSSSESSTGPGYVLRKHFSDGGNEIWPRHIKTRIRPIRAF